MGRPIVIDLFCGLGGWTEGFVAEKHIDTQMVHAHTNNHNTL